MTAKKDLITRTFLAIAESDISEEKKKEAAVKEAEWNTLLKEEQDAYLKLTDAKTAERLAKGRFLAAQNNLINFEKALEEFARTL